MGHIQIYPCASDQGATRCDPADASSATANFGLARLGVVFFAKLVNGVLFRKIVVKLDGTRTENLSELCKTT